MPIIIGGVSQGSILGPTLWKILDVGLWHKKMLEGIELFVFIDDVIVVVQASVM